MTSNMEDSGTLTALERLSREGRVAMDRVMVLRTVSNFTMPPEGRTAGWSTTAPYPNNGEPALRAAFTIGSHIVRRLVDAWETYATATPGVE